MKRPPLSGGNRGNQGRKLSIKELHSINLIGLLNNQVVKSFFPPRKVYDFDKTRALKGKARKKTRH